MEQPSDDSYVSKLSAWYIAQPDKVIPLNASAAMKGAKRSSLREPKLVKEISVSRPSALTTCLYTEMAISRFRIISESDRSSANHTSVVPPTPPPPTFPLSRTSTDFVASLPPPDQNTSWAEPRPPATGIEHPAGPLPTQGRLVFPLPYSRPLSLPAHVTFQEAQIPLRPEISLHVSLSVLDTIRLILRDIQQWKEHHNLFALAALVRQAEEYTDFEAPSMNALTGEKLVKTCLWPYSDIVHNLHMAFVSSESFYDRLLSSASGIPNRCIPYLMDTARLILRDRVTLRIALRTIVFPFYHWSSRSSMLLAKLLAYVTAQTIPDDYSCGILRSKSVQMLAPTTWIDDDVINYFSGNPSGQQLVILGNGEVLFCSPLFWSSLLAKYRTKTLKDMLWDGILNLHSMSKIKRILVPIHYHQNHWILAHCNLRDLIIEIYDTLPSSPSSGSEQPQYGEEVDVIKAWLSVLRNRFKSTYPPSEREPWTIKAPMVDVPEQGNPNDCGVYVIMFVRHLTTGYKVNHDNVHRMEKIGRRWKFYTVGRLRFWVELPKSLGQWETIPKVLRHLPSYQHYAANDLPI
ncbi:hypothetical protein ONZ45_g1971 [Pleurotus djamor]|nr:hypothetical protein ONZ45_g1971 [Pleurotus djamor]